MTVNLLIKNVPEALAEKLRLRAERHHRSLQGELMAIVSEAARGDPSPPPAVAAADQGTRVGWMSTAEVLAELKRLYPDGPVDSGPLGVDIVRAARDSR